MSGKKKTVGILSMQSVNNFGSLIQAYSLKKMVEIALQEAGDTSEKILIINHCNCPERAREVMEDFLSRASFKETMIMDTAGIKKQDISAAHSDLWAEAADIHPAVQDP